MSVRQSTTSLALVVAVAAIFTGSASGALRVVGGTATQIQAAPWTVFVTFDYGPQLVACTGSVIDASHVLTAAHCLYDPSGKLAAPASVAVRAGVSNYVTPAPADSEQDRSVVSFRIHPGYAFSTSVAADDVAVLALAAPLDLTGASVRAVVLPAPNTPFPAGAAVSVAGFGLQDPAQQFPSGALDSMTATTAAQGQCGEDSDSELALVDNAITLCTTSPTSALCHGDSGSGVVTTGPTPTLVGVAIGGRCEIGGDAISMYVGAPEILRFVEGDDHPPIAPRPSIQSIPFGLDWGLPLVPGDTVTCSPGSWPSSVHIAYSFVNVGNGQVLQTGAKGTYVVPTGAVGTMISCVVALTNDGGTTVVDSTSTPTVAPAPRLTIRRHALLTAVPGRTVTVRILVVVPARRSGTVKVCVVPPASVSGRRCRSATARSRTARVSFRLRVKSTAPLGTTRIAVKATAGTATATSRVPLRIRRR